MPFGANVDTKIVQMKFENSQFERNIAKSTKSLADLKKELKFGETSNGLKKFFHSLNGIDLSGLTNNIAKLTDKFTGLGHVSEMVLTEIQSKIRGMVSQVMSFVDSMTTAQITIGKGKYEQLNKSVQTIINATGESEQTVYAIMKRLNDYTDQTSYDFADMANNIGKFTSVGRGLDESEKAMEGIANWAALSGAGINEASRAMYNLSQALSVGHVALMDWRSIQNANMGTKEFKQAAIDAAVATGDLTKKVLKNGQAIYKTAKKYGKEVEVTYQNFESTLNKGWLTNDALLKVLNRFADTTDDLGKKAYEAAQKCTTFTDVLQAWKDMISTGWMNTFRHIFGDLVESMEFLSNVCNKVSDDLGQLIELRNTILEGWAQAGGRKSFLETILGDYGEGIETGAYGILDVLHDVGKLVSDGFWAIIKPFADDQVGELWDMDDGKWRVAWLTNQLLKFTESIRNFIRSVRSFFAEEVTVGGETTTRLEMIQGVIKGIAGAIILASEGVRGLVTMIGGIITDLSPSFDAIQFTLGKLGESLYDTASDAAKSGSIISFFEDLRVATSPLTSGINELVTSLSNLVLKFLNWGSKEGNFKNFADGFKYAVETIVSSVSGVGGPVFGFIADLANILSELIDANFSDESMANAGKKVGIAFNAMLDEIVNNLPQGVKDFWEKVKGIFGGKKAEKEGEEATGGFADIFKNLDLSKTLGIVGGAVGLGAFFKLYDILQKIRNPMGTAIDIIRSIKENLFGAIKSVFTPDDPKESSKHLLALAVLVGAIGYLVSQVAGLANVGWSGIGQIFAGLTIILGGLTAFVWGTKKLGLEAVKIFSVSALAYGIQAMVVALLPLGKEVDWSGLIRMGVGLVFILSTLLLTAKIIGKFDDKATAKIEGIERLAIGIGLLVFALKPLAKMEWVGLGKMGAGLVGILVVLGAFAKWVYGFRSGANPSVAMAGIIGLAVGIGLLVMAIKPFATMEWESMGKMGAGLAGILLILGMFAKWVYNFPQGNKPSVALGGIIGLVIGIGLLVMALQPLAGMSWESLGKMAAGLVFIMFALGKFAKWVNNFEGNPTTKMAGVFGLAIGIGLLIIALQPLASIEWENLGKMAAGLVFVMVALGAFATWIKKFEGTPSTGVAGLIGLAIGIGVLVLALLPLANTKWENLGKMAAGLVFVMGALLIFAKAMSKINLKHDNIIDLLAYAGAISAICLAFGLSVMAVQGVDIATILAFSVGLGIVLAAMAAAMKITSSMGLVSGLKGILLIAAGVAAIMGVLTLMMPMLLGSVGNALQSMAGRLRLVGNLFKDFTDVMGGIGDSDISSAQGKLDQIKAMLQSLSGVSMYAATVDSFSTTLWSLSTGLEIFSDHMKKVGDLSDLGVIKLLKDIQSSYSGVEALANMNMANLQANIAGLGGAMMLYAIGAKDVADATGTKGVDEQAITAAVKIMHRIAETMVTDGEFVIPQMPASDDLALWGARLAALAGALVEFEKAGQGLGAGTDKALETLDFFKQLKDKLETTDFQTNMAWVSKYMSAVADEDNRLVDVQTGEELLPNVDVLVSFGNHIEQLGKALAAFATSTSNINEETGEITPIDYTKAVEALEAFMAIKEKLPNVGGVYSWIKGTKKDLIDLGTEIEGLGDSLTNFSSTMNGEGEDGKKFDSTAVSNATKALTDIYTAIEDINKKLVPLNTAGTEFESGYKGIVWTAEDIGNDIGSLGTGLGKLGSGLHEFSVSTVGEGETAYDPNSVGYAVDAMESMIEFMQRIQFKLPVIGGIGNAFKSFFEGHTMTLTELSGYLGDIGEGLGKLGEGISKGGWNAGTTGADAAFTLLDHILAIAVKLGELTTVNGVTSSTTAWMDDLAIFLDQLTSDWGRLSDGTSMNHTIVENLSIFMNQLDEALDGVGPDLEKLKALNIVTEILQNLSGVNTGTDLKAVGFAITQGTADGLAEGTVIVKNAGITMVTEVYNALTGEDALKFDPIGLSIITGIANAITTNGYLVSNALDDVLLGAYTSGGETIQQGSPSRLFAIMGGFISQGLAMGIRNDIGYVTDASTFMGEAAINSTAGVLSTLSSMLDEDLNVDPTISPVIDLSNFNSGMGSMQKAIDRSRMSIDTSVVGRYAMRNLPHRSTQEINQNGSDYSGLYSRIDQATERIDTLGEKIAQMKLVMDGDVVAGGVSDGVDRNLGRSMFYASRNN